MTVVRTEPRSMSARVRAALVARWQAELDGLQRRRDRAWLEFESAQQHKATAPRGIERDRASAKASYARGRWLSAATDCLWCSVGIASLGEDD